MLCGWVCHQVGEGNAQEPTRQYELALGLDELCIMDDGVEPAESEEWLCSIDRGGLTRITGDAYLFFVPQSDDTSTSATHR